MIGKSCKLTSLLFNKFYYKAKKTNLILFVISYVYILKRPHTFCRLLKKQCQSSEQVILSDALIQWLFNVCKLTIEWLPSTFFVTYRIGLAASSLYGIRKKTIHKILLKGMGRYKKGMLTFSMRYTKFIAAFETTIDCSIIFFTKYHLRYLHLQIKLLLLANI